MDNPQRLQLKLILFPFFFSCKAVVRNSARNMSPTKDIFYVYMFPVKQRIRFSTEIILKQVTVQIISIFLQK